jgi:hypothetical protein
METEMNARKVEVAKACILRLIAEGKVSADYVKCALDTNRPLDGFFGEDDNLEYIEKEEAAAGAKAALESLA